jgi:myxalamid-type polyketide synthase MxaE and MxaD
MSRSAQEIEAWMIDRLSRLTGVAAHKLDARRPIQRYGLDSLAVVAFLAELEAWLGYQFYGNPLDEHPTVAALARFLEEETAKK